MGAVLHTLSGCMALGNHCMIPQLRQEYFSSPFNDLHVISPGMSYHRQADAL